MSSAPPARAIDTFGIGISRALPASQITTPDSDVIVDGMSPQTVVAPRDEHELALVLHEAQANRLGAIPVGGGQHLAFGNLPSAFDVAISMRELSRTIDHEPDDVTVTVDAGVTLGALQQALGEHGQRLPIDPPCAPIATVGGLLATNAYGPARHSCGTLRDWLIGLRVAHPGGAVTKSGGRVVKNVNGYDMHKLHIGAIGSLGVIVQATFKLAPLPHIVTTATFAAASAIDACSLVMRARDAGLAIEAAEVLSPAGSLAVTGEPRWCALLRVAGTTAAVERSLRELRALASDLRGPFAVAEADDPWPRWYDAFAPAQLSLRVSVLPSQVGECLGELTRQLSQGAPALSATVSTGVIRLHLDPKHIDARAVIDQVLEIAVRRDGFWVVDAAPPGVKANLDVFGPARSDFAIMRRLKEQFDPHRTLSPGRFAGRL